MMPEGLGREVKGASLMAIVATATDIKISCVVKFEESFRAEQSDTSPRGVVGAMIPYLQRP